MVAGDFGLVCEGMDSKDDAFVLFFPFFVLFSIECSSFFFLSFYFTEIKSLPISSV